jgi:hypothetical protein
MKLITLLTCFAISNIAIAQNYIGKYRLAKENEISPATHMYLHLYKDSSFAFYKGPINSCWFNFHEYGKWKIKFDTLILTQHQGALSDPECIIRYYIIETKLSLSSQKRFYKFKFFKPAGKQNEDIIYGHTWGNFTLEE